jgi:photosystem II stability/assembly factor-like uncharacterized protein
MNKKYTYWGLAAIILLVLFVSQKYLDSPSVAKVNTPQPEQAKDPNRLYPQEYFFLDRNYPDFNVPRGLFQQRLEESIRFDKKQSKTRRGLDHPWTVQGPGNIGGRVNTIAIDPFNHNIILLGYSQGGIYQTKDGGMNWRPVFDDQASLSISHISFDAQSPGRVYAATGDVNISGYPFLGSGVYRSDDYGVTWSYTGLADHGVLSKIVVDPHDHQVLYAGSMGFPSHKGDEKGLFRSTDGGQSWSKSLTIDDSTGVIDIVVDPIHPGRVFASGWTRLRTNYYGTTQTPGTSLYRSDDYGATWIPLTEGLPGEYHSRTGLEITYDGTLFISYIGTIQEGECSGEEESLAGVYQSPDGGFSWDTVPISLVQCNVVAGFGWYFEVLKVNPANPDDIFLLGVDIFRTLDGGQSWFEAAPVWWTYEVHADKHDLVFAGQHMYLATDGGAYQQPIDGTEPWSDIENIPSTQFYRTTYNPHAPDQYFGGAQDNGTTGGNEAFINDWPRIFGGDGFQPLYDPAEPLWGYALTQNGYIWFSEDGGNFYDGLNNGISGTRFWDMPFIMSSHNSKILYAASNSVYKMNMADSVREWQEISHDLTKGNLILGDRYPAITALAQSGMDSLRLYVGTQDGKLWTSPDGGQEWIDLSENTPDRFVTSIATSIQNPQGVFVTYSGYRDNDHTPYIYHSEDAGESWTSLGGTIPMLGVNNLHVLQGWNDEVLFAGTDGGVYVSLDSGGSWDRLGSNFPYMPVYDLDYNPQMNTIMAATFSRGIMTFPVEELDLVSSVKSEEEVVRMEIYPTLANDHVHIKPLFYKQGESVQIAITDLAGNAVEVSGKNVMEGEFIKLDIGQTPQGMYIVTVKTNNKFLSLGKFVKI